MRKMSLFGYRRMLRGDVYIPNRQMAAPDVHTTLTGWLSIRLYTRYSQLSNWFDNRFDNRLYRVNGAYVEFFVLEWSVRPRVRTF